MLTAALLLSAVASAALFVRRTRLPRLTRWLLAAGAVALALAAGSPQWPRPVATGVVVMVDLSPSTRTAEYRHRAALQKRIAALLGATPHRIVYFADGAAREAPPGSDDSAAISGLAVDSTGDMLADLAAERTVFDPPSGASAVVLFSDGRFDLPAAAPPTYVVIDPLLESPADAAVKSLEQRGDRMVAAVTNTAATRTLELTGVRLADARPAAGPVIGVKDMRPHSIFSGVATGSGVLQASIEPSAGRIGARLSPGDAWPENDQLWALVAPPAAEQWWVGTGGPAGWRTMSPGELPTDAAPYLAPSVIVLHNIAQSDLTALQRRRLGQYVRELGGGVVILGGDRAFAAGGYWGTELDALSPLASTPPRPTTHWLLLADGSGSMAQRGGGQSLWQRATDAMLRLVPQLPPDDVVSIGSFSDQLSWWTQDRGAKEMAALALPPAGIGPHGPTNLEAALTAIAQKATGDLPRQLLLLTDADAQIDDPLSLGRALHERNIHLHVLASGEGSGLPALQIIISASGGTLVRQFDPAKWAAAFQTLERAAAPARLKNQPIHARFTGDLAGMGERDLSPWNRTWIKTGAASLASGREGDNDVNLAARWNVGEGRVLAIAGDPGGGANLANALAQAVAHAPRDPRFSVSHVCGESLRVSVDAADNRSYLNDRHVVLWLSDDVAAEGTGAGHRDAFELSQRGPGQYELEIPAPRRAAIAQVEADGQVIDRFAVAGRYAREFDGISNDHDAMERLARQTGGAVIWPRQTWPIDFHWPLRWTPLGPVLAIIGVVVIAIGLIVWKLYPNA